MTKEELKLLAFDVIVDGLTNTDILNEDTTRMTKKSAVEFGEYTKGVIAMVREIRRHENL